MVLTLKYNRLILVTCHFIRALIDLKS